MGDFQPLNPRRAGMTGGGAWGPVREPPSTALRANGGGGLDSADVCVGEVFALEEKGFSGHVCKGVGEAVAEVEGGRVVALAELSPSASGGGDLFRRYGDDLDGLALKECIEFLATC